MYIFKQLILYPFRVHFPLVPSYIIESMKSIKRYLTRKNVTDSGGHEKGRWREFALINISLVTA